MGAGWGNSRKMILKPIGPFEMFDRGESQRVVTEAGIRLIALASTDRRTECSG